MKYKLNYKDDEKVVVSDMIDLIEKIKKEKSKIDQNPKKWSVIKKIINEYEYIYTSPNPHKNIADIYPYSRSYFKMKEIINNFSIIKENNNIFCIAEAPGGFIQCLLEYNVNIDATSLLSNNTKIPYWNKKLMNENPINEKINFNYGIKNNGDICDTTNLLSLIKGKNNYYDIITADGGFDYSTDYNSQEKDSLKLIYSEIFLAINTQKIGGSFVCKIFDIFLKETIYLVYILSLLYENIYFHKPCMSRMSNSEKYLICTGYKGYNKNIINILFRGLVDKIEYKCPNDFLNSIHKFNEYYLEKQISKINEGSRLFNKSLKIYPTNEQIEMTLKWCKDNNVRVNKNCYYLNPTRTNQPL